MIKREEHKLCTLNDRQIAYVVCFENVLYLTQASKTLLKILH